MRIGIYVGSFNPPHEGHHKVIKYLLDKDLVDEVWMLPTPNYWDKKDLVNEKERAEMLKVYEEEKVKIDTIHNKDTYTVDVLKSIQKDYPKDELYLVIGSDNLEKLHEWKEIKEILKHKIIVLKRKLIVKNKYLEEYDKQFIYCEDFDFLDVSSTQIRKGDTTYLHPDVKKYIEEHHLYEGF